MSDSCLERKLKCDDVLHALTNLFLIHGVPENIRSDNGPEFTARTVRYGKFLLKNIHAESRHTFA
jgi:hypothetical protein